MGAGALAICKSTTAVRLKEDMKKVVARPGREQTPVPHRKLFGVRLKDLHRDGLVMNGVPALVWSVVEYLRTKGITQEGLFRVNGNVKLVEQLRHKYESGEQVMLGEDVDVHTAASLLKLFLREMPDGVVSASMLPRFIQIYQEGSDTQRENLLRDLIKELPDAHYSLLKYLCHFLTQVVEHCGENRMNVHNLATVFGPSCFHVSPGFECMNQQNTCNKIMESLLQDYAKFFECEQTEKDGLCEDIARIIIVKAYNSDQPFCPVICEEKEVHCQESPRTKEAALEKQVKASSYTELDGPKSSPRRKETVLEPPVKVTNNSESDGPKSSPRRKEAILVQPVKTTSYSELDGPKSSPRRKEAVLERPVKATSYSELDGPKSSPRRKEAALEKPVKATSYSELDGPKSSPRRKMFYALIEII
ncbi:protein FAM13A-like [Rhinophrynus dorsalis]